MTSFANIGGVADPRLGGESDAIGQGRHGSVAAAIAPTEEAKDARRRHSIIYTDSTIMFEDYHYWAQRSREYEKGLTTQGFGLNGALKMVLGGGHHNNKQPVNLPVASSGLPLDANQLSEKSEKPGNETVTPTASEDQYGITETQWDQAQRAARTATWGASLHLAARCTHTDSC